MASTSGEPPSSSAADDSSQHLQQQQQEQQSQAHTEEQNTQHQQPRKQQQQHQQLPPQQILQGSFRNVFARPISERSKSHPEPAFSPSQSQSNLQTARGNNPSLPSVTGGPTPPAKSRRSSWLHFPRHRAGSGMSGLREEEAEDDHLAPTTASTAEVNPSASSSTETLTADTSGKAKSGTAEKKRNSFSSLLSLGSIIYGSRDPPPGPPSTTSSIKSVPLPESSAKAMNITLGTSPDSAGDGMQPQAASLPSPGLPTPSGTTRPARPPSSSAADQGEWAKLGGSQVPRRSRSRTQRRQSHSTAASSTSPNRSERSTAKSAPKSLGIVGICALDTKARSKPSRNILTRLQNSGEFEIKVFGDKVILDEEVENWPLCDYLISFFSDGFPLDKAIKYANMRQPFCVNDLPMQKVLWDRRLCLMILDKLGVRTPTRVEVSRDGGPRLDSVELAEHVHYFSGVKLQGPADGTGGGVAPPKHVELIEDGDAIVVDGVILRKPFVEKPISGEDHNVHIYFPKSQNGGGGRRLFRKIGNKSSEWDPELTVPRCFTEEGSSYLYEQFLDVVNAEDIKAYTVGADFCHAETRKSPVVDGLVQRNTHGKEIRYITSLTKEEQSMASQIAQGFGQRICGFDLLRANGKSYVIDVNGWSFVKDNNEYYDKCAKLLKQMFLAEKERFEHQNNYNHRSAINSEAPPSPQPSRRPSTAGQHRQALKSILKTPSLQRLRGTPSVSAAAAAKEQQPSPPDTSQVTTPISSPPSFDFRSNPGSVGEALAEHAGNVAAASGTSLGPRPARSDMNAPENAPLPASKHSWKLKGMVAVVRHADRTPKQKFKFTFHTDPFVELLKGHQEEVLLKGQAALSSVLDAVKKAQVEGVEDPAKLQLLETSLQRKGAWTGTKVQIKPMFRKRKPSEMGEASKAADTPAKTPISPEDDPLRAVRSNSVTDITMSRFTAGEEDLVLDKLQLVIKWGGEPTHAARYQSQDVGENMRKDLLLMNKDILRDVRVFSSSERRVVTSAQIWAASFLEQENIPDEYISIRKDLLDDSNAAKDVMDKVKKKLKGLLRQGLQPPPQFAWPQNTPEPYLVVRRVCELMRFHRRVMRHNMPKLQQRTKENGEIEPAVDPDTIQARWCCGEDPELFKERWEKLFSEFADSEKVDPSKVSELYDTMKFDALHNRQFLEWVFTPGSTMLKEMLQAQDQEGEDKVVESPTMAPLTKTTSQTQKTGPENASPPAHEKHLGNAIADKLGIKKRSPPQVPGAMNNIAAQSESYFKLYAGTGQTRAKQDERLENLRELYRLAKILYDFICPQEYGIEDSEKLEIGLLTSLPLLKEIVQDLEEVQASEDAKSFVYFTKESHVYTLLNAMLEGGLQTKIARNAIPELDYLSQIVFELYEAEDRDTEQFTYSIRIAISPGCHTQDPLDLLLDSKHSISCAPRRTLTPHCDWKDVIETLRAKFHTVKLPKSFIAVNLSERHARDNEKRTKVSGLKDEEEAEVEDGAVEGSTLPPADNAIVVQGVEEDEVTGDCIRVDTHGSKEASNEDRKAQIEAELAGMEEKLTLKENVKE